MRGVAGWRSQGSGAGFIAVAGAGQPTASLLFPLNREELDPDMLTDVDGHRTGVRASTFVARTHQGFVYFRFARELDPRQKFHFLVIISSNNR